MQADRAAARLQLGLRDEYGGGPIAWQPKSEIQYLAAGFFKAAAHIVRYNQLLNS
jgi:hypothetical protein